MAKEKTELILVKVPRTEPDWSVIGIALIISVVLLIPSFFTVGVISSSPVPEPDSSIEVVALFGVIGSFFLVGAFWIYLDINGDLRNNITRVHKLSRKGKAKVWTAEDWTESDFFAERWERSLE